MPHTTLESRREYLRQWRAAHPEIQRTRSEREYAALKADPIRMAAKKARDAIWQKNPQRVARKKAQRQKFPEASRRAQRAFRRRSPYFMLWHAAHERCKKSGLEFLLTKEWAEANWTGICALTGIRFSTGDGRPIATSPSLDRIDSSKGYTPDNCRFVLWAINRFRGDGTDTEMLAIAKALVEHG